MIAMDLKSVQPGFNNEALDSQAVFRVALNALSHPGRLWDMPLQSGLPKKGHAAAAVLMLGLLDSECTLWLSPSLAASDVPAWLRFHTGCQLVRDIHQAQFVWVGQGDQMPRLEHMNAGNDAYPDQSATCVLEVSEMHQDVGGWSLEGPGIQERQALRVAGFAADFEAQWEQNHANFPRGVDLYLVSAGVIAGLPRTTRIQTVQES